ncbi:hypothetical protein ABL78_0143 [Leptomonas seymouri]|uniref:Uncharacterized protein n=1 Tax=Leptomonas seymouri TaxID=5684 RepID=A0A0N0P9G7_LEPSE|nr:hypothetical protein ABL78_0143 [Leptomonas seymouri]|eukprot:KPI90707.1 hypothetical protein ABL78_0143 [Leptomonas seymouri]
MSKPTKERSADVEDSAVSPSLPRGPLRCAFRRLVAAGTSTAHSDQPVEEGKEVSTAEVGPSAAATRATGNRDGSSRSCCTHRGGSHNDSGTQGSPHDENGSTKNFVFWPRVRPQKPTRASMEPIIAQAYFVNRNTKGTQTSSEEASSATSSPEHQTNTCTHHTETTLTAATVQGGSESMRKEAAAATTASPDALMATAAAGASASDAAATTPLERWISREGYQASSTLSCASAHSFSFSPRCSISAALPRVREGDPGTTSGSIALSNNTNTLSSHLCVNALTERTPTLGILPRSSRILSNSEGSGLPVPNNQCSGVPKAAMPLEAVGLYNTGRRGSDNGSIRTPPFLPPLPRNSSIASTNCAGASNGPVVTAAPTSEREDVGSAGGAAMTAASSALHGTAIIAPILTQEERSHSIVAARRLHSLIGSNNSAELILNEPASKSSGIADSGRGSLCIARPAPSGRSRKPGAKFSSVKSPRDSPYDNSSTSTHCDTPLVLDGMQRQVCGFSSCASESAASNPGTKTWATNASSVRSQSATQASHTCTSPPSYRTPTSSEYMTAMPLCVKRLATPPRSRLSAGGSLNIPASKSVKNEGKPLPHHTKSRSLHRCCSASHTSGTSADSTATTTTTVSAPTVMQGEKKRYTSVIEAGKRETESDTSETAPVVPSTQPRARGDFHSKATTASSNVPAMSRTEAPFIVVAPFACTQAQPSVRAESAAPMLNSSEYTPCSPSAKLLTIVSTSPTSGCATASPKCYCASSASCAQQQPQREEPEFELHHCSMVHWFTNKNSFTHSTSSGSPASTLLLREVPLSVNIHSSRADIRSLYNNSIDACGVLNPPHPHAVTGGHAHSQLPASSQSLFPACGHNWSADASVDVMLDVCCATMTAAASLTCKTDSLCHTSEESFTVGLWSLAGGGAECKRVTPAMYLQVSTFSRSQGSISGGSCQRSAIRSAGAVPQGLAAVSVAAAPSTTAMPPEMCLGMHAVVPPKDDSVLVNEESFVEELPRDGDCEARDAAQPMDVLLLDDPDAPPFARAARTRICGQKHSKESSHNQLNCTNSNDTTTATTAQQCAGAHCEKGCAECAAPLATPTAAVQSGCTTPSMMKDTCCSHQTTGSSPTSSPKQPSPGHIEAMGLHHGHEDTQQYRGKSLHPHKPGAEPLSKLDSMTLQQRSADVLPLTATETHMATTQPIPQQWLRERDDGVWPLMRALPGCCCCFCAALSCVCRGPCRKSA